ncbi:hypothetical protein ASF84_05260 [Pseudomonas sp. Leaf127]|uniref:hypothetical protein n=1 Tax=Pseudomonas sp. Leaf127 TaxID=1736267 RepID=UPI00070363E7|nr:hypothetical protein [Pseudomonas sp. Leaf127]KQQ60120.1 hypothetical protein ASF84_05260 [Pseudomonas sp. Leaf127]
MSTSFLRDHANSLVEFAAETKAQADADPGNFFLQLAAKNQHDSAQIALREASMEQVSALGELLDVRLIGPRANGTVPLDAFLDTIGPLTRSWKLAAHRLRYGRDAVRGVAADVVSALNFKLAGLAPGSTHIFITGNASPDLTGDSLLQATLDQTFRLLNSDPADFYDAVDAVGGRSANQLGEFMRGLDKAGMAVQFSWQSTQGLREWIGRPDEITRVRALLATVNEPEKYPETIEGSVAGITDTGRLALRTAEGKVLIRFPLKLTAQVQKLKIASHAKINVETSKYWDAVEKKDVFKRHLISVH